MSMDARKTLELQKTSVNVERTTFRNFKKWLIDNNLDLSSWLRQKMAEELDRAEQEENHG